MSELFTEIEDRYEKSWTALVQNLTHTVAVAACNQLLQAGHRCHKVLLYIYRCHKVFFYTFRYHRVPLYILDATVFFLKFCVFLASRSRSDSRHSLTHSVSVSTDLTDVTLVSDDTF